MEAKNETIERIVGILVRVFCVWTVRNHRSETHAFRVAKKWDDFIRTGNIPSFDDANSEETKPAPWGRPVPEPK